MAEWNNGNDDQWGGGEVDNAVWVATDAGQDNWNQDATQWNEGGADGNANFQGDGAAGGMNENDGEQKCFGCGEVGHRRAECPTQADIQCHNCQQTGHIAKECPDKKPMACYNCGEEGHLKGDCDKPRTVNRDNVADVSADEAWKKLIQATKEREIDDAKEALQEYVKALDGAPTFKDLQESFIDNGINFWFIGLKRNLEGAFTNMDLQGHTGKTYTVSYRFSDKPIRPREREGWPESREELISRLDDAGDTVSSGLQRCYNCDGWGHSSKSCPEPKQEKVQEASVCYNCKEEGHRLRDCPKPRVDKSACRNCNQSGHNAKDCPEPPNMDNMDCRKCGEKGHMAKDCPQGGGGMACHNCGKEGHMRKDCDQPRDYSKVQCSNCQEFGHTKVRCKQPTVEEPGDYAPGGGHDDSWNGQGAGQAGDDWGQGNNAGDTQFNGASDGW